MSLQIPPSLKSEHEALHADLARATKSGGRRGDAAKAVAKLMHPHFVKGGTYALPPLGLLPALAAGEIAPAMTDVLRLTDELEAELPQMLSEHRDIVAALERLVAAADPEGKPERAHCAQNLMAHAQVEEQASYPAALLIGRYLKAILPASRAPGG